jgi:hypothetical protein
MHCSQLTLCWDFINQMVSWPNVQLTKCQLTKWQVGQIASWPSGTLIKWFVDQMAGWPKSRLTKWLVYQVTGWWNALIPKAGANIIKLFKGKFTNSFCQLDYFKAIRFIPLAIFKDLAYKKEWVNLHQKSFMRLTSALAKMWQNIFRYFSHFKNDRYSFLGSNYFRHRDKTRVQMPAKNISTFESKMLAVYGPHSWFW